jgi:hypothetical protein
MAPLRTEATDMDLVNDRTAGDMAELYDRIIGKGFITLCRKLGREPTVPLITGLLRLKTAQRLNKLPPSINGTFLPG